MRLWDPATLIASVGTLAAAVLATLGAARAEEPSPQRDTEPTSSALTPDAPAPAPASSSEGVEQSGALDLELERAKEDRAEWTESTAAKALPKRAEVVALTVSGGVSLGSHEAGQIYLLSEALRSSPDAARLLVASGASAGNANALIGATEACLAPNSHAENSLGYRVWVDVGFNELFDPEHVTSRSIFVQDALNRGYDLIKKTWQSEVHEECEFVVGLSATRVRGVDVELAEGVSVPRQPGRVIVKVEGQKGRPPTLRNYLDPSSSYKRTLLPFSDGLDPTAERDLEALRPAVLASAAFPVAFEPVPIPHCTTPTRTDEIRRKKSGEELLECKTATRIDEFMDGGVFDNNPLGITAKVAEDGLVAGPSGPSFRRLPTGGDGAHPSLVYAYVDPDIRNYPKYEPPQNHKPKEHPLLGIVMKMGGDFLSSSRAQELASVAERSPQVLDRLWIVKGNYPPTSELLGAFFGFFERDFRDFDFHLGTYDTYRALREETADLLGVDAYVDTLEREMLDKPSSVAAEHQALACLVANYEPETYGHLAPLCKKRSANFRALLQLSILRLWSNCQQLSEEQAGSTKHMACKKAYGGFAPPRVDGSYPDLRPLLQRRHENDFDHALRVLAALRFEFTDLGLDRDHADRARIAIRRTLEKAVQSLADAQPTFMDRTLVMTAGRTVVNKIRYEPPRQRGYALIGTAFAAGYLHRMGFPALHFNADARLFHIHELLTGNPELLAGAISAGFEYTILPLSGILLQTSVGARFGYQMSAADSVGVDPCEEDRVSGDSRRCSQILVMTPLNLTLLERGRFSFTPRWYPVGESFGHDIFDFELGLGLEFF